MLVARSGGVSWSVCNVFIKQYNSDLAIALGHIISYKIVFAPSKGSDQPTHLSIRRAPCG